MININNIYGELVINGNNVNTFESASINEQIQSSKYNKLTLDKFSNWYTYENQITLGFPLLRKYENILRSFTVRVNLDKKYHYRPEYLSNHLYGTTDLWYVIMFLNKMTRVTEFKTDTIIVPMTDLIKTINRLVEDEENNISKKNNPRQIKKNFLKKLHEPSDEIIKREIDDTVAWFSLPNMSSKYAEFVANTIYYFREYETNTGWLRDEMDRRVAAIKLDPDNLTSIPSVFFKEGYNKTLRGRINLASNKWYSFNTYMNGRAKVTIRDSKTKEKIVSINPKYYYPEATLINDMRAANESNSVNGLETIIKYDSTYQGKYTNYINNTVLPINETNTTNNIYNIETAKFFAGDKVSIRNASRLDGKDNIFFNLEYVNDLSDKNIIGYGYSIEIEYTDETKIKFNILNENKCYDTKNKIAYLKGSLPLQQGKSVKEILLSTHVKVKPDTTQIALKSVLYSFEISAIQDEDIINKFKVNKSGWYDLEISYEYTLVDPDLKNFIYKDQSFMGVYFNPTISEVYTNNKINHLKRIEIQDMGNTIDATQVDISNPFILGDINKYSMYFSNNMKLVDKYILDFSLDHLTKDQGGGVGFIVDYDQALNTGYMFWINGTSQGNTNVPKFSRDPNSNALIMPTGFYELDNIYGESHNIFEGDNSLSLKVTNYHPIDLEDKEFRLIKKHNRLKLYAKDPNTNIFDMTKTLLDVEDIENIQKFGEIGMLTAYSRMKLNIDEYTTWDLPASEYE